VLSLNKSIATTLILLYNGNNICYAVSYLRFSPVTGRPTVARVNNCLKELKVFKFKPYVYIPHASTDFAVFFGGVQRT